MQLTEVRRDRIAHVLRTWRDSPPAHLPIRLWHALHESLGERLLVLLHRCISANTALRHWLAQLRPPTEEGLASGGVRADGGMRGDAPAAECVSSMATVWEMVLRKHMYAGMLAAAERRSFGALTPRRQQRHLIEDAPLPPDPGPPTA